MSSPTLSVPSWLYILAAIIIISPVWGAMQPSVSNPSPVQVNVTQTQPTILQVSVSVEEFVKSSKSQEGFDWDCVNLENEPLIAREGWPNLPFIARAVLIPLGSRPKLAVGEIQRQVEEDALPVPYSATDKLEGLSYGNEEPGELSYGEDFLNYEGIWPVHPVELGEPAVLRGYCILPVRIFPVQYDYPNRELIFNEAVEFSLEFDAPVNPETLHPAPEYQSRNAWRAVEALVENPPPPPRDDLLSANYLYIVPEFEGADSVLAPLIEWRNRQGHKVQVAHLANAAAAADILAVIRAAYAAATPVEFVALVGDVNGQGMRLAAASQNGDYAYTTLAGNDPLPDIAIGRISAQTLEQLGIIVNKLVSYEAAPFMDNTNWYRQGCVVAGSSINGISEVYNAKYVRRELLALGFTEVRHWYHDEDGDIANPQNFLIDSFDWGISVLHYRAYQNMNGLPLNTIENLANRNGRWPAVLAISCNTGDYTNQEGRTEAFLRARGGGIGAIGTATQFTMVQFNNMMAAGVWRGIYKMKLYAFGWGLNFGKYELWRAYQGFDNNYANFMDWNNLMGDPGTHIWTGIPRLINAQYPQQIALGESHFRVTVTDRQNGNPEPEALVCLYKPDETHLTAYTNARGIADFYINPAALTPGELKVTVTKHNVHPILGASNIAPVEGFLGSSSWTIQDENDAMANPGESFVLSVAIANFSENSPGGRIRVNLVSLTEMAVVQGAPVILNQAPEVGDSAICEFEIEVSPEAVNGQLLLFQVTAANGQDTWISGVSLITAGGALSVRSQRAAPAIARGQESDFNLEMVNSGGLAIPAFEAALSCDNELIEIIRPVVRYPALDPNAAASGQDPGFRLRVDAFAIPGSSIPLRVTGAGAFGARVETVTMLQIGRPQAGDPFGPDKYGYICFDSGDRNWQVAPEYDWVEIDPNVENPQFQGTLLNLQDARDDQDASVAVDLPFRFQYYGQVFEQITICTNGWAAFGDQSELADFRNRHIAQAEGPNAQLAVWWDNLTTREGSAILTYYDEGTGRFIVEWNHMFRLLNGGAAGAVETFQLILFDPAITPTFTGDGIITYQYKEVTNENRPARNDTPYCTIGISNLDDSDGLEYTYWNVYAAGAAPLENEMAITFTTTTAFTTGVIQGHIVDAANNQPLPGARLTFFRGQRAQADNNGFYQTQVLIGDDIWITAAANGYLDSTRTGLVVAEDETLTVNFALLHPEFTSSQAELSVSLNQNAQTSRQLTLSNDGNGPLTWSSELTFEVGEAGIRQRMEALFVGRNVNDLDLEGAVFANGFFYICGRNGQNPNMIYVVNSRGEVQTRFQQPGAAQNGMFDLEWDGNIIWGSGERAIIGFDTSGREMARFNGPYANNQGIAWDSDHSILWISSSQRNQSLRAFTPRGEYVTAMGSNDCRITGLAYWPEDPDGCPLYMMHCAGGSEQSVYKGNPETEEWRLVASLAPVESGPPGGIFISRQYGLGWTLHVLVNDHLNVRGDRIDIWQLGTYRDWMALDPAAGQVPSRQRVSVNINFTAVGLMPDTYEGSLRIHHNAREGLFTIPVHLEVLSVGVKSETALELPDHFDLEAAYPNPFNAEVVLNIQLPVDSEVRLQVFDLTGRLTAELLNGRMPAGEHQSVWSAQKQPSGVYWCRFEAGGVVRMQKLAVVR